MNGTNEREAATRQQVPHERVVMRCGSPIENGLYVAYVNPDIDLPFAEKKLLTYVDGDWGYLGSDQIYRGHVYGYIGPLPALRLGDA